MQQISKDDGQLSFDSRCSESRFEASNTLYQAIVKNLNNEQCHDHQRRYQYYYSNRLLCQTCFRNALVKQRGATSRDQTEKNQYLYHLRNIINHPILLLARQQTLSQCPNALIDFMLNSFQPLFSKRTDLTIQRQLLDTFILKIKTKINALCDSLVASFERAEEHLTSICQFRDQMKHIGKMYEQQFEEMLAQRYTKGSKAELESILNQYHNSNENPFDKIFNNLDEVMSHLAQSPIINTQELVDLYTTITDERLWKCSKIIYTKSSAQSNQNSQIMILDCEQTTLQNEYILQMNEDSLILKRDEQQLGRLDITFDSLYHLKKYRLLGVNYESIQIINYFDRLKIDAVFQIQGCTDILPFEHDIIVVSNENLIRIDMDSNIKTVLGCNFKQLRYDNECSRSFICENSEGRKAKWSLKSTDSYPQWLS